MKPYELLAALMAAKGKDRAGRPFGASALARAVKRPQPTIHRLMAGDSKKPDFDTVAPIAAYFEVPIEAFYEEKAATAIAKQRGLKAVPPPMRRERKRNVDPTAAKIAQIFARVAEGKFAELTPEEKKMHAEVQKAYAKLLAETPNGPTGNTQSGDL